MRNTNLRVLFVLSAALIVAGLLSSCAVTTRSMEGTTETMENTSDASTDTTSSTSPRDTASADPRVLAFARANLERLRTDMAAGGGEHLASLGSLLRVSPAQEEAFFSLTRTKFDVFFVSESTTAEQLLARLDRELASRPQLRN